MTVTKLTPYTAAAADAITGSAMNSLANATNLLGTVEIDNTTDPEIFMDIELYLAAQGGNRSVGASVPLFIIPALDGTNYADLHADTTEPVSVYMLDGGASGAKRMTIRGINLSPCLFKIGIRNLTGQAFAASGNTLRYRLYSTEST